MIRIIAEGFVLALLTLSILSIIGSVIEINKGCCSCPVQETATRTIRQDF